MLLKRQWPFQLYMCLWKLYQRLVSVVMVQSYLRLLDRGQKRSVMYLKRNASKIKVELLEVGVKELEDMQKKHGEVDKF